jgi:hypothetical protein
MKLRFIRHSFFSVVCLVALSASAAAQGSTSETTQNGNGEPAAAQPSATAPTITARSSWEPMGGFDLDSHSTGYAWGGPQYQYKLRDNLALVARGSVNYLFYEYENGPGMTKVAGPGFSTQVGLKVGETNWFKVAAGPTWKRRNQRFEGFDGTEVDQGSEWHSGVNFGGDVWLVPTRRVNIMGQAMYATDDNFAWSRFMARRQLTNLAWTNTFTHYLGGEVVGMGNDDFRSFQLGGLLEFAHVRSSASIGLRAGWKRQTYDVGADKTGPYFGIGYWQRIQ